MIPIDFDSNGESIARANEEVCYRLLATGALAQGGERVCALHVGEDWDKDKRRCPFCDAPGARPREGAYRFLQTKNAPEPPEEPAE